MLTSNDNGSDKCVYLKVESDKTMGFWADEVLMITLEINQEQKFPGHGPISAALSASQEEDLVAHDLAELR